MDSLITAAARALAAGDPLGALKRVALRDDAPAPALRGIATRRLRANAARAALARAEDAARDAVISALTAEVDSASRLLDGDLRHGTWEGDQSDLPRIDPRTGEVLESLEMPPGVGISGLESDGADQFFCGGGRSGKVRAVRRPKRGSA